MWATRPYAQRSKYYWPEIRLTLGAGTTWSLRAGRSSSRPRPPAAITRFKQMIDVYQLSLPYYRYPSLRSKTRRINKRTIEWVPGPRRGEYRKEFEVGCFSFFNLEEHSENGPKIIISNKDLQRQVRQRPTCTPLYPPKGPRPSGLCLLWFSCF